MNHIFLFPRIIFQSTIRPKLTIFASVYRINLPKLFKNKPFHVKLRLSLNYSKVVRSVS